MTSHQGPGWRLAPCLVALEAEADRIAPRRSRRSDGSIGDAAHRSRPSDHNPDGGIVHAIDLTHDPKGGFDVHAHIRAVAARRDPRLKYGISLGQIWTPERGWHHYVGPNPHNKHAHFSCTDRGVNDIRPWLTAAPTPTPPTPTPPAPEADEMIMRNHHDGSVWLYDGGGLFRRHVGTPQLVSDLLRLGVPFDDIKDNPQASAALLSATKDVDAR